ncbi:MAG: hypothetical protein B6U85_05555 [Desulfurococcales archaeon ex4484_42]|nr:MAG: hypothetical protein B6U85_05555 [Desulfurococcales archaeon ex4484_42]
MATPHVRGILALVLQLDMKDGKIDLNQTLAEELLENSTFKITWHNAAVYDPIISAYKTVKWGDDAVGSGLIQAVLVIHNFMDSYG